MFENTRSVAGTTLKAQVDGIKAAFGITWTQVTWEDLRKPLYSGLGARLFLALRVGTAEHSIPRSIASQAQLYVDKYRSGGSLETYKVESALIEEGCKTMGSNGADIVFVVDMSGSVGSSNFQKQLDFMIKVIDSFDVGMGDKQNRFSVMTFSSTPYTEFQLNKYDNKAAMTDHIRNINYGKGSTYTDRALQLLVQENFQEKNGARKLSDGHPHVAIVITDGKSENVAMTKQRAQEAKDQDVTIIAVGIGMELNQQELKDMASSPSCQHVMTLVDFNEFTSLQDTLSKNLRGSGGHND
jgi:uncharacterized protein YegL